MHQGHPELDSLRGNYYQWLTETSQDEKAGEVKESEGDFQGAINLYLKAGLPAKAARLAISRPEITNNSDTVSRIAASLIKGEFYERVSGLVFLENPLGSYELITAGTAHLCGLIFSSISPFLELFSDTSFPNRCQERRAIKRERNIFVCLCSFKLCLPPPVCYFYVAVCLRTQFFLQKPSVFMQQVGKRL